MRLLFGLILCGIAAISFAELQPTTECPGESLGSCQLTGLKGSSDVLYNWDTSNNFVYMCVYGTRGQLLTATAHPLPQRTANAACSYAKRLCAKSRGSRWGRGEYCAT